MSVFVVLVLVCLKVSCIALSRPPCSRRKWIQDLCRETRLTGGSLLLINGASVGAVVILDDDDDDDDDGRVALPMNQKVGKVFRTRAMAEYTNSISASRDTNVSPMEAYDTITAMIPPNKKGSLAKALDVGAGAGYSTLLLYDKLGYKDIDAVDWSGDAWRSNVLETPPSVRFFELDDDSFFQMVETETSLQQQYGGSSSSIKGDVDMTTRTKYQVICYNFAVNAAKAVRVARTHLAEDGMLLAPINDRPEYWYKQTYYVLNSRGEVLEQSGAEVGAWSVQFQPDVTSTTCSGIWCGNMNGFNEKRAKRQEQQEQQQR